MSIFVKQPRPTNRPEQAGFTLTELAMVLVIIALLFVFIMPTSTALLNTGKRELTRQRLKTIDAAFINYVTVNRRLPCPAVGTVAAGAAGTEELRYVTGDVIPAGFAIGDCKNNQVSGIVPYIAIGLTEADIIDGWDRRITYRAAFGLTRDSALDMTSCDPAGTKAADVTTFPAYAAPSGRCWSVPPGGTCVGTDMTTCTSPQLYLAGKGFDIRNGDGTVLIMAGASFTGAAYVLISHGENGYGAYNRSGTLQTTSSSGVAGAIEAFNINGSAVSVTAALPATANTFRDAELTSGAAATYFDDFIVRPSVFSVIQRAQLGPRSH